MNRPTANLHSSTIICIDSYEKRVPTGRVYAPFFEHGISFSGVIDILLQMDHMLNELQIPQAYENRRSFNSFSHALDAPAAESDTQSGKLATFSIKVLFQQYATWQGTISWLEGGRVEGFRSVLELITLLDSALTK